VLELSLPEAMAMGLRGRGRPVSRPRIPNPIQVAFNVCSTALAVAVTFATYHYCLSHRGVNNPKLIVVFWRRAFTLSTNTLRWRR